MAWMPSRCASGAAVIIAPGGYCVALAIEREGHEVARWLQRRGIAAIVLKYRTREKREQGIPHDLDMDQACRYGIADGIQAIKLELEDLSFAVLHPKLYVEIESLVKQRTPQREEFVQQVIDAVGDDLKASKIKGSVAGRPKQYYSIYQKMIVRGASSTRSTI